MAHTPLQPLVSAIVSTYNAERFIRGCIEGLEQQTIADRLEIIVIDSGSPQHEGAIVRELQGRYGNIRYLRTEQRETVYGAWNRGIALARGRYITNANTDDRHRSDAFELMTRVMESRPAVDLVYADVLITRTPNETFDRHTPVGSYVWYDWDRNILLDKGCFIGPQPMWRRSLHELYGGFDSGYVTSGDYEFWLRISQTAEFFHISQSLGLYLGHRDSIEHQNEETKLRENDTISELYHHAAREGRIIGLLPVQQLRTLIAGRSPDAPCADIISLVASIEARLIAKAALSGEQMEYYHLSKAKVLGNPDSAGPLIDEFLHCVEQLIIGSREWYVTRRSVEDTASDDAPLRLQILSEAILKARRFFQRGTVESAVATLLEQGIKATPLSPVAYFELTDILMAAGRYDDALQVLPEMPPSADVCRLHEVQALCFAAQGQDEAARQAAVLATDRPRALVTRGTLAARAGDLAGAEEYFQRATTVDPTCGAGWLSLGMLLWSQGNHEAAWQAVKHSVVVDPLNDDAVMILRDMAGRNHRHADSLLMVSEAVQLYPDSRNLGRHHAELLARSERNREALEACGAFLARFGADEEVLNLALQLRRHCGSYDRLAESGTHSISLCMIVNNEEKYIAGCLASLKPVVDEMIVVDTGSTDRTVDIAAALGAKVFTYGWNGNFSDARNYSLEQAKGAWILVMDADEVISPQDYGLFRTVIGDSAGKKVCWSIVTRNYTGLHPEGWVANDGAYPREERAEGWSPSLKLRLFPNDSRLRFAGEIHEMIDNAALQAGFRVKDASFVVHHYGTLAESGNKDSVKKRTYFELGRQKLAEHPDDLQVIGELAVQAAELELYDEAISLWERFLRIAPDAVVALFNKGFCLMGLKRYAEARDVSLRVLQLDSFHKEAAFNYGTCELYAGDPETALDRVRPVAERNRQHPLLQALTAVLCLACGKEDEGQLRVQDLRSNGYGIDSYLRERVAILNGVGRSESAARIMRTGGLT